MLVGTHRTAKGFMVKTLLFSLETRRREGTTGGLAPSMTWSTGHSTTNRVQCTLNHSVLSATQPDHSVTHRLNTTASDRYTHQIAQCPVQTTPIKALQRTESPFFSSFFCSRSATIPCAQPGLGLQPCLGLQVRLLGATIY